MVSWAVEEGSIGMRERSLLLKKESTRWSRYAIPDIYAYRVNILRSFSPEKRHRSMAAILYSWQQRTGIDLLSCEVCMHARLVRNKHTRSNAGHPPLYFRVPVAVILLWVLYTWASCRSDGDCWLGQRVRYLPTSSRLYWSDQINIDLLKIKYICIYMYIYIHI